MNKRHIGQRLTAMAMVASLWLVPIAAVAQQTRITAPKNKYKVSDDVKLGADAAKEVEDKFPIIQDRDAERYVTEVGERLVRSIPQQFRHPEFNYRFEWVNASDINAFALPGGPMYVNRGMLNAAKNEGEMAGVMAHEISHVALRHATAQATKQGNWKNQLGVIGLILGGAVLGGQAGAQLGALGAQVWMTKYSREYESQADMLGSHIMADAGYDPRDLANMFKTIAAQGNSGPEWLSSHPDPGNRYEKILHESQYLNVSQNPIGITRDFERIQAKFRAMPPARTMAEIEKSGQNGGKTENPTSSGRYTERVAYPSSRTRTYSQSNVIRLNVPSNWLDFSSQDNVQFAPEGAYGDQGITRGAMIGIHSGQNSLLQDSENYLNEILQSNSYLRQQNRLSSTYVAGRRGYVTTLSGRSPITGETEIVTVYTTELRNGQLLYIDTVTPGSESSRYDRAFRNMLNSIRLND